MFLQDKIYGHRARIQQEGRDISTPEGRRSAWWYSLIYDHGILRKFWTNLATVAPGVLRANQPDPKQLRRYAGRGIKSIVNLRGASGLPFYLFEVDACKELGLTLFDTEGFSARQAPPRDVIQNILTVLRTAPKPVLMHCKSGADRTSLIAAAYLLAEENATVDQARKQLSPRFIHFKWTKTGVLDAILDAYETAQKDSGITFEDWLETAYDPDAIQAAFDASRA